MHEIEPFSMIAFEFKLTDGRDIVRFCAVDRTKELSIEIGYIIFSANNEGLTTVVLSPHTKDETFEKFVPLAEATEQIMNHAKEYITTHYPYQPPTAETIQKVRKLVNEYEKNKRKCS
jgi:hypothetical protein